jgi:hypothetical protein
MKSWPPEMARLTPASLESRDSLAPSLGGTTPGGAGIRKFGGAASESDASDGGGTKARRKGADSARGKGFWRALQRALGASRTRWRRFRSYEVRWESYPRVGNVAGHCRIRVTRCR